MRCNEWQCGVMFLVYLRQNMPPRSVCGLDGQEIATARRSSVPVIDKSYAKSIFRSPYQIPLRSPADRIHLLRSKPSRRFSLEHGGILHSRFPGLVQKRIAPSMPPTFRIALCLGKPTFVRNKGWLPHRMSMSDRLCSIRNASARSRAVVPPSCCSLPICIHD